MTLNGWYNVGFDGIVRHESFMMRAGLIDGEE